MTGALLLFLAPWVHGQSESGAEKDLSKVFSRDAYQTSAPPIRGIEGSEGDLPKRKGVSRRVPRRMVREQYDPLITPPSGFLVLLKFLLYGFLALVVGVVIMAIVNVARRSQFSRQTASSPPRDDVAKEPDAKALEDFERLASEGRFDEAVHALLLTALQLIETRRKTPFAEASTAREILSETSRSERPPLSVLVRIVERSLFAERPATADDYARSLEAFREIKGAAR